MRRSPAAFPMVVATLVGLWAVFSPVARAALERPSADRCLSPYFKIEGGKGTESFPLKSTSATVRIVGSIADVRIVQEYCNRGSEPIEAVYVFPASTRAAVHAMKMTVGGRVRIARVMERQAAAAHYETAKRQGKGAALLEEQRPNVFQMKLANVMPGDTVTVELGYTELLVPTEGVYEFVYPAVVGPRYMRPGEGPQPTFHDASAPAPASPAESGPSGLSHGPFLRAGQAVPYSFSMDLAIEFPVTLGDVLSPSHAVEVSRPTPTSARLALPATAPGMGDRDVIVRYGPRCAAVESGLVLHEGETENYFLLLTQAPARVDPSSIPPREYVFVLDVSGSMEGFPLDTAKTVLRDLIGGLRPVDSFDVVLFAGASAVLSDRPVPATAENLKSALDLIDRTSSGGGTELLPALRRALAVPRASDAARVVALITDGNVACESEAFDLVRRSLSRSSMFTFGIGSSVNRHLIEGLARAGRGEPFVVTRPEEAAPAAKRFARYISTPVMTDITVSFEGFGAYDVEPVVVPDLLAERPITVLGKWRKPLNGRVIVKGRSGGKDVVQSIDAGDARPSASREALRYLWARGRIATLADDTSPANAQARRQAIVELGLAHNLLTAYTSFVAVDDVVVNPAGKARPVSQPVPLPAGVSESAVGGDVGTAPEPSTWALLVIAALALLASLRGPLALAAGQDGVSR